MFPVLDVTVPSVPGKCQRQRRLGTLGTATTGKGYKPHRITVITATSLLFNLANQTLQQIATRKRYKEGGCLPAHTTLRKGRNQEGLDVSFAVLTCSPLHPQRLASAHRRKSQPALNKDAPHEGQQVHTTKTDSESTCEPHLSHDMWKNNRRDSQLSCSGENYYHHSRNIPHPRMVRHIPGLNNTLVCAVSSSLPRGHPEGRADVPERLGKNSTVPGKLLQKRYQASAQPAHRVGLQDTPLTQHSSPSVSSRDRARVQGSSDLCDVDREIKRLASAHRRKSQPALNKDAAHEGQQVHTTKTDSESTCEPHLSHDMGKNNRRDSQLSCSGENYYHHSRNIPHPRMVRHIPGLNNTLVCAVSSSLPRGHPEGRADVPERLGKNSTVPEKLLQKRYQASAQPAHGVGLQDTPLTQHSSPSVSSRDRARVQGSSDLCDVDREIKRLASAHRRKSQPALNKDAAHEGQQVHTTKTDSESTCEPHLSHDMGKNNRRDSQLSCSGENYYHHSRNIPHPRMVRHIPGLNNTLVCAVSSSLPRGHPEGRADVPERLGKNSTVPGKLLQKRFQASAQAAHRVGLQDTPLTQHSSPSVSSRDRARVQGSSDLGDTDQEKKVLDKISQLLETDSLTKIQEWFARASKQEKDFVFSLVD
ncbi:uncharacterized protein LOC119144390 isoform X2 [Falco rusticolus]|uniref:uncharacterized protein LOC119144390 isoform X2 n=1 Tax=Falco rusticolus TaxID=120794 RepID=UPI00188663A5|nr:uncharacterized protein LOC119144390 isoform X2 [Falco rusticolus]